MGRWSGPLLGLALAACAPEHWLPPPGSGEVAVVYTNPEGRTVLAPASPLPFTEEIDPAMPLWALVYSRSLESLQLSPGPIEVETAVAGRRPPPLPDALLRAEFEVAEWVSEEAKTVDRWSVPALDPAACLTRDLCVDELPSCVPCPAADEPRAPTLPTAPCPPGWSPIDDPAPVDLCQPGAPPRVDCAASEWQPPESATCLALSACDATWPAPRGPLPALYVAAGARGGDGSLALPFGTLSAALAARATPHQILVAAGHYLEPLNFERDGWIVRGACPLEVRIDGAAGGVVVTASVTFEALGFEGRRPLRIEAAGRLTARALRVGAGLESGVVVTGHLQADGLLVEDRDGPGVSVVPQGSAHLVDAELRGATLAQLEVNGGHLSGRRIRLDGLGGGASCESAGVVAVRGATVELQELVSERHCQGGIRAYDPGTVVRVEDALLRDHLPGGLEDGHGLTVYGGARASLRRVGVIDTRKNGVGIVDAQLDAEDLWISGTVGTDPYSYGLWIGEKAQVALRRAVLRHNVQTNLESVSTSSVSLRDVVILPAQAGEHCRVSTDLLWVNRLYLADARVIYLSGQRNQDLSDITIEGGDLETSYVPSARMSRVRSRSGPSYGLRVRTRGCAVNCEPMILEDLDLTVAGAGVIGLELESVPGVRVERFRVHGGDPAVRGRDEKVELRWGEIIDAPLALWLTLLPSEPVRIFGSLRLRDVDVPLRLAPVD